MLPTTLLSEALAGGAPVPVLLGTNRDEARFFMALDPLFVTNFLGLHPRDPAVYERDARLATDVWRCWARFGEEVDLRAPCPLIGAPTRTPRPP